MSDLDGEFTGEIDPERLTVRAIMERYGYVGEIIIEGHGKPKSDLIVEGNVIRNKRRDDKAEPPCSAF